MGGRKKFLFSTVAYFEVSLEAGIGDGKKDSVTSRVSLQHYVLVNPKVSLDYSTGFQCLDIYSTF